MKGYVIEHRNRGVFVGFDWNNNVEWKPKFRWSIRATEGNWYGNEARAKEELAKIEQAGVRGCTLKEVSL